jgi:hypothetical protein
MAERDLGRLDVDVFGDQSRGVALLKLWKVRPSSPAAWQAGSQTRWRQLA